MNIKILDSWLREYLDTKASPKDIANALSLTSVSVERVEKFKEDYTYDIEVTTNRPDVASVIGLAREAGAVLPQQGIEAAYKPLKINASHPSSLLAAQGERKVLIPSPLKGDGEDEGKKSLHILNDPKLVNRVCAVVMEVTIKPSPQEIQDRLASSGIRSINNLVDITNYVMRVTGQPTHVMDYDRVGNTIKIREAKKGEHITTLDKKTYTLSGGDIVAENENGEIIDLLGIMGLENSVVTEQTNRIIFFINNVDSHRVRKTSMELGIRTEAVQLNEKHLDSQLCKLALEYGTQLYKEFANGTIISDIIDLYPNKPEPKDIEVSLQKIDSLIGVHIPEELSIDILTKLGFRIESGVKRHQDDNQNLIVTVPTFRLHDVRLPEDIIEEIARVYGYHNLPSTLPLINTQQPKPVAHAFYFENRVKHALKYWGFTEVYTYSMVPETLFEGPLTSAVTIANPLNEDFVYMRRTIIPSLLHVISENKKHEHIQIFEIANVYEKKTTGLPEEIRMLSGVIKSPTLSFFRVKGYIEQLLKDIGIHTYIFQPSESGGDGAKIIIQNDEPSSSRDHQVAKQSSLIGKIASSPRQGGTPRNDAIGQIEILDENLIDFEINFDKLISYANLKKTYTPPLKFPPIFEDITFQISKNVLTQDILAEIKKQDELIKDVSLLDRYSDSRTFHITYQDETRNMTTEEVKEIHTSILKHLGKKWGAREK